MDKRLFLIDGHALVFKMYYAFLKRPMINSKGADMSILFGFTKYILELIEKEKPTHLAVAFDPPGGTFRHEMYPEYKATREETPQLVIDALEPLTELCEAMHIPVLMVKGYEADDVIGTVAKKEEQEGFKVYMVTPDKDYGQLITENILLFKPGKAGNDNEIIGTEAVCSKYGISNPRQVIDMLTICGDTSDNVPGVKGVGEKGAGKLIAKYGSVKNIYDHLDDLTPKQREAFESARDHIRLSQELVTIRTDVPIGINADEMAVDMEYDPNIVGLFDKYEFGSLKKYIGHLQTDSGAQENKTIEYLAISPSEAASRARKVRSCSIRTESYGESIFSGIRKVTVGIHDGNDVYIASGTPEEMSDIISDESIEKYGYDLKRQCNLLSEAGIRFMGKLLDIELMHYVINPEKSHKPEILAKGYLDIDMTRNQDGGQIQQSLFNDEDL